MTIEKKFDLDDPVIQGWYNSQIKGRLVIDKHEEMLSRKLSASITGVSFSIPENYAANRNLMFSGAKQSQSPAKQMAPEVDLTRDQKHRFD